MTRYLGALLLSTACSWLLTPEMRKIALARGIVDRPRGRHIHAEPVPFLGGVAMYAAFLIATVAFGRPDRNTLGIGDRVGRLQAIVIGFFVPEIMRSLTETSQFGSARHKP